LGKTLQFAMVQLVAYLVSPSGCMKNLSRTQHSRQQFEKSQVCAVRWKGLSGGAWAGADRSRESQSTAPFRHTSVGNPRTRSV